MLVKNTYRELVQVSFNVADEFRNEALLIGEFIRENYQALECTSKG